MSKDTRRPSLTISMIGGNCPVQGQGTIDGVPFYFRARGEHWSFSVGQDPVCHPDWILKEPYGDTPFAAGWMSEEEARAFIEIAADRYRKRAQDTQSPDISAS